MMSINDVADRPRTTEGGRRVMPDKPRRPAHLAVVVILQISVLAMVLLGWQYLPDIKPLREHFRFFDPFFVSSPRGVWSRIVDMGAGRHNTTTIWADVGRTMEASLIGTAVGMFLGGVSGLILSNSPLWSRVLRPFISALNAVPRVALIPIVVVIFGPTLQANAVVAILVVYFIAFFSAYEGGTTVPTPLLQNARLLGASSLALLYRVRLPYVMAWTMASLPLALGFSLLSVVTAEILTGSAGMGHLLALATVTVDASTTIGVAIYLAAIGAAIVALGDFLRKRSMKWWFAQ